MTTETATRFTFGPWHARSTSVYGSGCLVAQVPSMATTDGSTTQHERAQATARLIAAAPELLTAVHAALAYVVATGDLRANTEASGLQAVLRAAIREAEGRSA